jgi:hypothetical protein
MVDNRARAQLLTRRSGQESCHGALTRFLLGVAFLTFVSGCVYVPSVMWKRAEANRARLDRVHVGQTMDEVRATMVTPPERREARLRFDHKTVELWSWASDYARKLDTTIIFVDGRVEEIRTTSWEEKD